MNEAKGGRRDSIATTSGSAYRAGGFLAKFRKYTLKAQCRKNVANLSLDRGLGARSYAHIEWLRYRAEHKAKESPTVAASDANVRDRHGHPVIYRRYRGDCGHEWTCSLGQLGRV